MKLGGRGAVYCLLSKLLQLGVGMGYDRARRALGEVGNGSLGFGRVGNYHQPRLFIFPPVDTVR